MFRHVTRAALIGTVAGVLWFYASVPGWGTFARSLFLDGLEPAALVGLMAALAIGWFAGSGRGTASVRYSVVGVVIGVVAGRLAASLWWGILGAADLLGAVTLGFTEAGQAHTLTRVTDPLWIRAASAALVILVFSAGVAAGRIWSKRRAAVAA